MTKKAKVKSKKELTGEESEVMKKINIKVAKEKPLGKNNEDMPIKKKGKKRKSHKTTKCLEADNAEPSDSQVDQEDEGYVEPVTKDIFSEKTNASKKLTGGNRMVIDEDEDFGSVGVKKPSIDVAEESDSDSAPDEGTISTGKKAVVEDNLRMKKEIMNIKKQVKEARRLKHEKNRVQQMKKRERLIKLENSRLPEDLLNAVAREEKKSKEMVVSQPKQKITTFSDDMFDDQIFADAADEDDVIPLNQAVQVKPIQQELKKHASIASIAADFRYKALYTKVSNRMTSVAQRQMKVKQWKSGKCT